MKLTCAKRCRMIEFLANFRCPGCFGSETSGDGQDGCECRLTIKNDPGLRWE